MISLPTAQTKDAAAAEAAASSSGACCDRERCCRDYQGAVELIGKRWTGAIVMVLLEAPARFSEIRQLIPEISDRLLSERLKELEEEGIVTREVGAGSPPHVEYGLTAKGRALEPAVRALKSWATAWHA